MTVCKLKSFRKRIDSWSSDKKLCGFPFSSNTTIALFLVQPIGFDYLSFDIISWKCGGVVLNISEVSLLKGTIMHVFVPMLRTSILESLFKTHILFFSWFWLTLDTKTVIWYLFNLNILLRQYVCLSNKVVPFGWFSQTSFQLMKENFIHQTSFLR